MRRAVRSSTSGTRALMGFSGTRNEMKRDALVVAVQISAPLESTASPSAMVASRPDWQSVRLPAMLMRSTRSSLRRCRAVRRTRDLDVLL
jgi:hypothetical protein